MSYPTFFSQYVRDLRVGQIVDKWQIVGVHQETTGNVHVVASYTEYVPCTDSGHYYVVCGTNGDKYVDGSDVRVWANFYTDDPSAAMRNYFTMIGMDSTLVSYI
jgi:hypothetical protein